MSLLWEGLQEALALIVSRDPLVYAAAFRSLWISLTAVLVALAVGLLFGTLLARVSFVGNRALVTTFRVGMAAPTVFIGIVCYALLSRRGPLGPIELLYTPWAIVIGEFFLALPIITSIVHNALASMDERVYETTRTLGAGKARRWLTYLSETRHSIVLAVLTAFARCVTELGIAMMVGGNIKHHTRTLATATALETGKGEFGRGLAMGIILLILALGVTVVMSAAGREFPRDSHD